MMSFIILKKKKEISSKVLKRYIIKFKITRIIKRILRLRKFKIK